MNTRPIAHTVSLCFRCDCPTTFRILMESNCVLCDVGTSMLCALYTDVGYSHEAVPTLTPKFQTSLHNAAQTVRTPAVRIPPPCHRSVLTRKTSGHCLQSFSAANPPNPQPHPPSVHVITATDHRPCWVSKSKIRQYKIFIIILVQSVVFATLQFKLFLSGLSLLLGFCFRSDQMN